MSTQQQSGIHVTPISHASGILSWGGTTIYFDPVGDQSVFAGKPTADIVLITHEHGDHFSTSTLENVVTPQTTLIVTQTARDLLPADLAARAKIMANGDTLRERGITITAIPAYNLPGVSEKYHPKGVGNGYVLDKDGTRVYIAGDSAGTPEMRALVGIDIAFVPMNLPYTMSVEEAADAVLAFKPKTIYPYHYRGPDGLSDVAKFKQLINAGDPSINVVLLNWYPK